jgi:hypothetical protein
VEEVFVAYLNDWEQSVKDRDSATYSKSDKERMLLSAETRLGLKMTGNVLLNVIHPTQTGFSYVFYWPGEEAVFFTRSEGEATSLPEWTCSCPRILWRTILGARGRGRDY